MVLIIGDEQVSNLRGEDLFDQFRSLRGVSEKLANEELRKVRVETFLFMILTLHCLD